MSITRTPKKVPTSGRPKKYQEPSRPITVTLPESTLEGLRYVHPDRGRAIVKLTEGALSQGRSPKPLVEILNVSANAGLLIIGPCAALRQIPFLHLVEVAPGRFLLALESGNGFKHLEIAIQDVLEDLPKTEKRERELIQQLLANIRTLRKAERMSMAEILLVSTAGK